MSSQPTPRQVLYALVAGGFVLIVIVLTIGAAVAGVVPDWWSLSMALAIAAGGGWVAWNWRRTLPALAIGIGLFLMWMIGTLLVAG